MLEFPSKSAFADVGHDLSVIDSAHYTDSITYDSLEDEPVLRAFEDDLNFTSLRRAHHNRKVQLINNDNFTPSTDPDTVIFASPMVKTLFNPDLEIKIGSSIYKFLNRHDDFCIKVTGENKFSIVNNIEETEGNAQGMANLLAKSSVFLMTSNLENLTRVDCRANFNFSHVSGSTYSVSNVSTIGGYMGTPKYTWTLNGAQFSTAANPPNKQLNDGDKICLAMVIEEPNGNKCHDKKCKTLTSDCEADFTFDLDDESKEIDFKNKSTTEQGSIVSYDWSFGDGYSSLSQNPSHQYQKEGEYNVCLEITTSVGCTNEYCENIKVKDDCCEGGDKNKKWDNLTEDRKVKTKVWVRNVLGTHTTIGAKTRFFKDDGWIDIDLFGTKADKLNTDVEGYVWFPNNGKCDIKKLHQNYSPPEFNATSHKIVTRWWGPNTVPKRLELKSMGSFHWAKNDGDELTRELYIATDDWLDCF